MSTETNSCLSQLSDEELLKEILSELDKIKQSNPVQYERCMNQLFDIFDLNTESKSTFDQFVKKSHRVIEYADELADIDKDKAVEMLRAQLAKINMYISQFTAEEIREARKKMN